MSKARGVNKLFLSVTAAFTEIYVEQALELGALTLLSQRSIKKRLNKKAAEILGPIIDDYFKESVHASNKIVSKEISRLADNIGLPMKFNRDLIDTYNDTKSVLTGYYSNDLKGLFKNSEIDKMKRTILSAKYSNWTDEELATAIRNTVNTTKNRALVIARQETARLNTAAVDIYYDKVKKDYEKVWISKGDARPDHKAYDGQIADEDGYFYGPLGETTGPPLDFGCRCTVELRKRTKA
jgi:SPP1 gp7 family putative phage head morphogenesis protein